MPDVETRAAAALLAAAFDTADKHERRALWRKLRAAVSDTRGAAWRPGEPWAALLTELGQQRPRRWTTGLGAAPGGQTNRQGDTRPAAVPWAWWPDTAPDTAEEPTP